MTKVVVKYSLEAQNAIQSLIHKEIKGRLVNLVISLCAVVVETWDDKPLLECLHEILKEQGLNPALYSYD